MDSKTQGSRMWNGFKSIASTLLFVWLITHHIAQATVVPTESMSPTILVGDHFFLDKQYTMDENGDDGEVRYPSPGNLGLRPPANFQNSASRAVID